MALCCLLYVMFIRSLDSTSWPLSLLSDKHFDANVQLPSVHAASNCSWNEAPSLCAINLPMSVCLLTYALCMNFLQFTCLFLAVLSYIHLDTNVQSPSMSDIQCDTNAQSPSIHAASNCSCNEAPSLFMKDTPDNVCMPSSK